MKSLGLIALILSILFITAFADTTLLTSDTFEDFVNSKKLTIVKWHIPWDGNSRIFSPAFAKIADSYENDPSLSFAHVDCDKDQAFCRSKKIYSYPVVVAFVKNESGSEPIVIPYGHAKTVSGLRSFVSSLKAPSYIVAANDDEYRATVNSGHNMYITYTLSSLSSAIADKARELSKALYRQSVGTILRVAPTTEQQSVTLYIVRDIGKVFTGDAKYVEVTLAKEIGARCHGKEVKKSDEETEEDKEANPDGILCSKYTDRMRQIYSLSQAGLLETIEPWYDAATGMIPLPPNEPQPSSTPVPLSTVGTRPYTLVKYTDPIDEITPESITSFIRRYQLPIYGPLNSDLLPRLQHRGVPILWLFYPFTDKIKHAEVMKLYNLAAKYIDRIILARVNTDDYLVYGRDKFALPDHRYGMVIHDRQKNIKDVYDEFYYSWWFGEKTDVYDDAETWPEQEKMALERAIEEAQRKGIIIDEKKFGYRPPSGKTDQDRPVRGGVWTPSKVKQMIGAKLRLWPWDRELVQGDVATLVDDIKDDDDVAHSLKLGDYKRYIPDEKKATNNDKKGKKAETTDLPTEDKKDAKKDKKSTKTDQESKDSKKDKKDMKDGKKEKDIKTSIILEKPFDPKDNKKVDQNIHDLSNGETISIPVPTTTGPKTQQAEAEVSNDDGEDVEQGSDDDSGGMVYEAKYDSLDEMIADEKERFIKITETLYQDPETGDYVYYPDPEELEAERLKAEEDGTSGSITDTDELVKSMLNKAIRDHTESLSTITGSDHDEL